MGFGVHRGFSLLWIVSSYIVPVYKNGWMLSTNGRLLSTRAFLSYKNRPFRSCLTCAASSSSSPSLSSPSASPRRRRLPALIASLLLSGPSGDMPIIRSKIPRVKLSCRRSWYRFSGGDRDRGGAPWRRR